MGVPVGIGAWYFWGIPPAHCSGDVGGSYFKAMNETAKELAMPLATTLLAIALATLPFTLPKAIASTWVNGEINVHHMNSCN